MKRLYVLTRKDLGLAYQAVQGAHAVAEFHKQDYNDAVEWDNQYLIMLEVDNLDMLDYWAWRLESKEIAFTAFFEPDLENEMTAIAVFQHSDEFKNLPLMGVDQTLIDRKDING